jgi:lipopolysaccharide transport system permease protein
MMGWLWLIVRPLLTIAAGTFLFHVVVGIEVAGVPYFLYFLVGMTIWNLFERSVVLATRSIEFYRKDLRGEYFPRILLLAAATAPALLEFAVYLAATLVAVLVLLVVDGRLYLTFGLTSFLALLSVVLTLLLAMSICCFTSVLIGDKRDLRFGLQYALRFWYALTPVIYPMAMIREDWRVVVELNPMTLVVQLYQTALLGIGIVLHPWQLVTTLGTLLVGSTIGLWFFNRAHPVASTIEDREPDDGDLFG